MLDYDNFKSNGKRQRSFVAFTIFGVLLGNALFASTADFLLGHTNYLHRSKSIMTIFQCCAGIIFADKSILPEPIYRPVSRYADIFFIIWQYAVKFIAFKYRPYRPIPIFQNRYIGTTLVLLFPLIFVCFQAMIIVKCICQFGLFSNTDTAIPNNEPFHPRRIIGVEKKDYYAAWDVTLLMILFFHRYVLKVKIVYQKNVTLFDMYFHYPSLFQSLGLWKDVKVNDESAVDDIDREKLHAKKNGETSPNTSMTTAREVKNFSLFLKIFIFMVTEFLVTELFW